MFLSVSGTTKPKNNPKMANLDVQSVQPTERSRKWRVTKSPVPTPCTPFDQPVHLPCSPGAPSNEAIAMVTSGKVPKVKQSVGHHRTEWLRSISGGQRRRSLKAHFLRSLRSGCFNSRRATNRRLLSNPALFFLSSSPRTPYRLLL